ncbi:hypothetical protein FlaCF_3455 [Flavobacterium tructae]
MYSCKTDITYGEDISFFCCYFKISVKISLSTGFCSFYKNVNSRKRNFFESVTVPVIDPSCALTVCINNAINSPKNSLKLIFIGICLRISFLKYLNFLLISVLYLTFKITKTLVFVVFVTKWF